MTLSSQTFANTTAGQTFTLNRLNTRTLTFINGGTLTSANAGGGITDSVNIPITLSGNLTANLGTNHRVDLHGISGGGGTLTKTGNGELALFTSISNLGFDVQGGALTFGVVPTSISGPIILNGGNLNLISGSHSFQVSLLQNAKIRGYTGQSPTFTAATFNTASSAALDITLTLGGGNGGTIQGIIQDNTSKKVALTLDTANTTWTFSGANTYSGGTTVSAGTLNVSNTSGLGATFGATTINGSGAVLNLSTAGRYTQNGGVTLTSGSIIGSGSLSSSAGFTVQSGTISAVLAGTGTMTMNGSGNTVVLSGANMYVVLTSSSERAAWEPLVSTRQVAGVVTRHSLTAGEFESAIAAGKSLTFAQCYEWVTPAGR